MEKGLCPLSKGLEQHQQVKPQIPHFANKKPEAQQMHLRQIFTLSIDRA
ncbi:MAG: hypothetical protein F6K28_31725 [Microcoleus sp. SIO2G3]|nr:hypothetical protein [Microcoleus sp. SIO2G3]